MTVWTNARARKRRLASAFDHCISPGVPCPETVLVAVMTDRSYLLMGYPQGEPAAFVVKDDAGPLREALTAAFGSPTELLSAGTATAITLAKRCPDTMPCAQSRPGHDSGRPRTADRAGTAQW